MDIKINVELETQLEEISDVMSVRTYNCLARAGINTVGKLLAVPEEELIHVRNLGKKCVEEVLRLRENFVTTQLP